MPSGRAGRSPRCSAGPARGSEARPELWPARTQCAIGAGPPHRKNARRTPSRTAATASALMIGLALITFVAFLGAGLRSSYSDAVNKLFVADYALTAENGFDPFAKQADGAVSLAPGVT